MQTPSAVTTKLEVYDPAMCCSTGVCGPDVDERLVQFAADLNHLKASGVEVIRYNLGQEPEKFREQPGVLSRLKSTGSGILPIIVVNGEVVSEGTYPDRGQLEAWARDGKADAGDAAVDDTHEPTAMHKDHGSNGGAEADAKAAPFAYDERTEVLVVIGAAMASGCAQSLRSAFSRGRDLGLSENDLARAMQAGINIRQAPMQQIIDVANRLLGIPESGCTPGGGCC